LCRTDCEFPLFGNAFISEVKCSDSYDGPGYTRSSLGSSSRVVHAGMASDVELFLP
jgi:hypothetical protein